MLDPRLYTFLVLCDTMNYTRAAQRLCITQPAVTHHIHFLEDHYGCRLFLYQGKTLSLTPAGERLRELARSLAYNSSKMERAVSAARPVFLRVGATRTIGEYVVAPLVERFLREAGYPDSFLPRVLELVIHHHAYESRSGRLMQLLLEADLIVNCYEAEPGGETLKQIKAVFETPEGKELFSLWRRGAGKERYEETEHYPDAH